MSKKVKAFLFNLLSFFLIFLVIRFVLGYLVALESIYIAFISAFITTIISPKFFVVQKKNGAAAVFMKILFVKEMKEVG